MTDGPRVLVSGASVAGPVVAYWLQRFGYRPTVIERAPELRLGGGGHAVDLFGPAVDVMSHMGVLDSVQDARTRTNTVTFVRSRGNPVNVDAERLSEGVSDRHVEIMRGDLARILNTAAHTSVDYLFDDTIRTLAQTGDQVEVTFERAPAATYDLVVGADGLHSTTRALVFDHEARYLNYLGGYLAVFSVPNYLGLEGQMLAFAAVGRTVAMYPAPGTGMLRVLFLFRSPAPLVYDHHDLAAQRRLLRGLYAGLGWQLPRLLDELEGADDFYLDSISQIRMDSWSKGRVTLVGDAGYSPGPAVGGGTSLAVVGGYVLAAELAAARDHVRGFEAYQRALGPAVHNSRKIGPTVLKTLIPNSPAQVWLTARAMQVLPRLPGPARRKLTSFGGGPAAMLAGAPLRDPQELLRRPR
jgi:2-polyprenyl-6-methoxyphenol hydroxylase-like FAD-dependent oxidoreductase